MSRRDVYESSDRNSSGCTTGSITGSATGSAATGVASAISITLDTGLLSDSLLILNETGVSLKDSLTFRGRLYFIIASRIISDIVLCIPGELSIED